MLLRCGGRSNERSMSESRSVPPHPQPFSPTTRASTTRPRRRGEGSGNNFCHAHRPQFERSVRAIGCIVRTQLAVSLNPVGVADRSVENGQGRVPKNVGLMQPRLAAANSAGLSNRLFRNRIWTFVGQPEAIRQRHEFLLGRADFDQYIRAEGVVVNFLCRAYLLHDEPIRTTKRWQVKSEAIVESQAFAGCVPKSPDWSLRLLVAAWYPHLHLLTGRCFTCGVSSIPPNRLRHRVIDLDMECSPIVDPTEQQSVV